MSAQTTSTVVPVLQSSLGIDEVKSVLAESRVASALPPERFAELAEAARVATFLGAGQVIVSEDDEARDFYIVLEGEVAVTREDARGNTVELAHLRAGDIFGESALLDGGPRSATVTTAGPCRLLVIDGTLRPDVADNAWVTAFLTNLAREATRRLRDTNATVMAALRREADENQRRLAMGHFLMWLVVAMCLYIISLGVTLSVTDDLALANLCTNIVILGSVFGMWRLIAGSPYPRSTFGFVLNPGWRREIGEALVWSLFMIAACTGIKQVLISTVDRLADVPLFDSAFMGTRPLGTADVVIAVTYFAMSPLQEMIARGCLQSSLTVFLEQRPFHVAQAIVLSNLIFAANHAHLSPWFTLLAFAPGILWGVLYHRQRSLLGVSISHAIVGTYALKVLGLDLMARM